MRNALDYLRDVNFLLGKERRKLPWLVLLFLGASTIDLAGLGLVGSYVTLLTAAESPVGKIIPIVVNWLGYSAEDYILFGGIFLLIVFIAKPRFYF